MRRTHSSRKTKNAKGIFQSKIYRIRLWWHLTKAGLLRDGLHLNT